MWLELCLTAKRYHLKWKLQLFLFFRVLPKRYFAGKNMWDQNSWFAPLKGDDQYPRPFHTWVLPPSPYPPPRPPPGVLLGSGNDASISEDKSNRARYPFLVSSYASFTYGFFIYTSSSSSECANQTSRVFVVVAFCLYQLEERTGRRNLAAKCFTCTRKLATFLLMN